MAKIITISEKARKWADDHEYGSLMMELDLFREIYNSSWRKQARINQLEKKRESLQYSLTTIEAQIDRIKNGFD